MDISLGRSRCDAMESNNLVHCRRGSDDPVRHLELVSGSYFPRRNSKILKQVQDDWVWDDGGVDDRAVGIRAAHLCAFVALCEIHWRSVWFWRGCVLARYGRGPTRLALLLFLGYIVRFTVIPYPRLYESIAKIARNKSRFI